MDGIKNILIIRTDRIGDVVLTSPAIHALRTSFSQANIAILISPSTLDIVQGNPDIDEILIDDRKGLHAGLAGFMRLVKEIRLRNFDVVINFHTKKRTNLLSFLAGIPKRIGYRNNKFGFLLTDKIHDIRPQGEKHEAQYCLDVLKELGIHDMVLESVLPVQDEAERWSDEFFRKLQPVQSEVRFVALHLGASCPTKRWPIRYFADVVKHLMERQRILFIIIGTQDQQDMASDLIRLSGQNKAFYDLTGRTSLARSVSLLKRCDLLISNDSGPVHIAAAFNTPVVSIFTRNQPGINPERWCPLGECSYYVAPPLDLNSDFAKGEVEDHGFLYRVTPQQVLDVVDALF